MQVTETALTESASLRQNYTDTSVLDRVGVVATLPGDVRMTTEMVATFYGVDMKTVEKLVERHKEELLRNNLQVVRGDELRRLREELATDTESVANPVGPKTRHLTLFDRRTLLNVGMLLRDSETAKQVRTYLLEVEESATDQHRQDATIAAIETLSKKVDELSESLGDYNSIESEANGLNISVVADMLGVTSRSLREYLVRENWVYQPYGTAYLPTEWAVKADLVELAPKKGYSSARITANGRRVLRKTYSR